MSRYSLYARLSVLVVILTAAAVFMRRKPQAAQRARDNPPASSDQGDDYDRRQGHCGWLTGCE